MPDARVNMHRVSKGKELDLPLRSGANARRKKELISLQIVQAGQMSTAMGSAGGGAVSHVYGSSGGNASKMKKPKRPRRHHNKKMGNRVLRRVTQPAPNNNNEFLMEEHDHLYHLDQNEDSQVGMDERTLSSSEYEAEYLARDFSDAYDVVHAERLSTMSKAELIQEYQILEERVDALEKKLKSCYYDTEGEARNRSVNSGMSDASDLTGDMVTDNSDLMFSSDEDGDSVSSFDTNKFLNAGNVGDKITALENEVRRLRQLNRQLREANKILQKSVLNDPSGDNVCSDGEGTVYSEPSSTTGSCDVPSGSDNDLFDANLTSKPMSTPTVTHSNKSESLQDRIDCSIGSMETPQIEV